MTDNIVLVNVLPPCDLCQHLRGQHTLSEYDGATVFGPWAYMCADCFMCYGVGLGMGMGQGLRLRPAPLRLVPPIAN